jgi:hypothetical protein
MAKAKKPAPSKAVDKPYEPTPQEREILDAQRARKDKRPPRPNVSASMTYGAAQVTFSHAAPDVAQPLFMESLGTADADFMSGLLAQLVGLAWNGSSVNEQDFKFLLATVAGVEPKDEVEAMLAAQMAAVHNATMASARRLKVAETSQQRDTSGRAFNKLARTFVAQVEALKRYRTGGEQKVTVEHVTVNDGGQAIVGNVTPGGRGAPKKGTETS